MSESEVRNYLENNIPMLGENFTADNNDRMVWMSDVIKAVVNLINNKQTEEPKFNPPFRVGKKQQRAVLDVMGLEVVVFPKGQENMAKEYCDLLNNKYNTT